MSVSRALALSCLACLFTFLAATRPTVAADYTVGPIKISDPWSRATPSGAKVGAGYVTITNTGSEPDRLIGGSSSISEGFEVHEMVMVDNVMRMRALVKGLELKPGETVTLRPGGYHAMFMNLKQQLKEGDTIKGTLVFEKAGKIEIDFRVRALGSGPAPAHGGGGQPKH